MARLTATLFGVGDLAAGALVGVATTAAVRLTIPPGLDMALAMLAGMAVGMVVHLALGTLLSLALGMFHAMVPAGLIGMYGGMMFAMRDAMASHRASAGGGLLAGAIFGLAVVLAVQLYAAVLRRPRR